MNMPAQASFGISIAFAFVAWAIVAALYFWPLLRTQARVDVLRPLLLLHSFRFVGLAFLVKVSWRPNYQLPSQCQPHMAI